MREALITAAMLQAAQGSQRCLWQRFRDHFNYSEHGGRVPGRKTASMKRRLVGVEKRVAIVAMTGTSTALSRRVIAFMARLTVTLAP